MERMTFFDWLLDSLAYLKSHPDTPLEEVVKTVSGIEISQIK